ncbi:MAG: hypothetical protein CR982_03235 [Candidatus Cloacimonadota bacterium]|nr:MAG: hypothetical protein CR982_03235 [Candidatus Cloacimonadota bacterium]PIE77411.1 MAG: hypothetical protein CSA15_13095 [Candidatus Delongbacteria bacterium]
MVDKDILDRVEKIYYLLQYGKLMPGMIHNLNGRITLLDTRIQLAVMGVQNRLEKLLGKKESLDEESYKYHLSDLEYIKKIVDSLDSFRDEVNSVLGDLNFKIFNESKSSSSRISLKKAVDEFDLYFKFYKYYKHNTEIENSIPVDIEINFVYRDLYLILYSIVRNICDSIVQSKIEKGRIVYRAEDNESYTVLDILGNGEDIKDKSPDDLILSASKRSFSETITDFDSIYGEGLDLFFLNKILAKRNVKWEIFSVDNLYGFRFFIPK